MDGGCLGSDLELSAVSYSNQNRYTEMEWLGFVWCVKYRWCVGCCDQVRLWCGGREHGISLIFSRLFLVSFFSSLDFGCTMGLTDA